MTTRHFHLLFLGHLLVLLTACQGPSSSPTKASSPGEEAPVVTTTTVVSTTIARELALPGELTAHQEVLLAPKVSGFLDRIDVDRGSRVGAGAPLARLSAPEVGFQRSGGEADAAEARARRLEANARVDQTVAQRLESEAQLAAANATYQRLRGAAETPGAISGQELELARWQVEAEKARVAAFRAAEAAAMAHREAASQREAAAAALAEAARATEGYLELVAPFEGVITERLAHPGRLVHPTEPILRLQQITRLRLTVAVPEAEVAQVLPGAKVQFTVPAFPGQTFEGTVARLASAVTPQTRTMPVELDVPNYDRRLAPGMFPQVRWPANRSEASLLVPPSSIAVTTERMFVIRVRDGRAEWVDIKKGISYRYAGVDLIEVFGPLNSGEMIVLRGTDEVRNGSRITPQLTAQPSR
jgi:membrane fusion protein (multidrug efflux system)